uniref:Uncharacterized protein n=1 Tax=Glossina brevipalpis TaxID=37001 RepID=A0A1A9WLP5_9MUSC
MIISCSTFQYSLQVKQSNQTTTLRPIVDRIFLRKRRWLLFPKGSSLKFTVFVSKRLLALYPKGFSFNIEAAAYYPMPSKRIDVIPKQLHKSPVEAEVNKNHPMAMNLMRYNGEPRKSYNITEPQWPSKKSYYSSSSDYQKLLFKKMKLKKKPWTSMKYENNLYKNYNQYRPKYLPENRVTEQSHHYYGVRERRDLFNHFEGFSKIFNVDLKSCILRAICDSKHFLKLPGYSLLHDILRILFSFPTRNGLDDEYNYIMDSDYNNCAKYIYRKCPLSILDIFMNSKKNIIEK